MAEPERYRSCVLCKTKTSTMYALPKDVTLRAKWLDFIFGQTPQHYSVVVCSLHFEDGDFLNLWEYNMGFAKRLMLKPGAVPSSRHSGSFTAPPGVSVQFYDCLIYYSYCHSLQRTRRALVGPLPEHFLTRVLT